jgi:hypothetical protein
MTMNCFVFLVMGCVALQCRLWYVAFTDVMWVVDKPENYQINREEEMPRFSCRSTSHLPRALPLASSNTFQFWAQELFFT